jgi:hypothetical protein
MPMQLLVGPYAYSGMNRTVSGSAIISSGERLAASSYLPDGPLKGESCGAA